MHLPIEDQLEGEMFDIMNVLGIGGEKWRRGSEDEEELEVRIWEEWR